MPTDTLIDPLTTPLQVSEAKRLATLETIRGAIEFLFDASDVDELHGQWMTVRWRKDYKASDEVNRAAAMRFLRRHAKAFKRLGKVEKKSGEYDYEVYVDLPNNVRLRAVAEVTAVCHMVETGETQVLPAVPAQPERLVPKLKKVCPPSLLADEFSRLDVQ